MDFDGYGKHPETQSRTFGLNKKQNEQSRSYKRDFLKCHF